MSLVFGFEINEKPVSFSWNHENGITIVTQNAPQNDTQHAPQNDTQNDRQNDRQKWETRIMGYIWRALPKSGCLLDTQNDTQQAPQNEPQSAPLNAPHKRLDVKKMGFAWDGASKNECWVRKKERFVDANKTSVKKIKRKTKRIGK